MRIARAGLSFGGVLLVAALVLIMLGQAGLQAKCKDVEDDFGAQMSAEAANNVTNSVPAADSDLAANVTQAVTNSTQKLFDQFFQAAAQSSSFVRCARMYSVNWWVWVLQIVQVLWYLVAATGPRWPANATSFLLVAATVAVLNTYVATRMLGMSTYAPESQTAWRDVALAGFIIATAAQYVFILCGPTLARSLDAMHAKANHPPLSSSFSA